jgi:hypothetical protein
MRPGRMGKRQAEIGIADFAVRKSSFPQPAGIN